MISNNWPKELVTKFQAKLAEIDFKNTTPKIDDVLRFLEQDPQKIKVVIVGQDPYPTPGVANGRAFAVNKGKQLPQSLQNIFKEIKEVVGKVKTDETLEHWTKQGVLLLNRSLTTIEWNSNAHKHLWSDLTMELIKWLDEKVSPTFILWGRDAIALEKDIKHSKVVKDAHPSPLSFHLRKKNTFREINDIEW